MLPYEMLQAHAVRSVLLCAYILFAATANAATYYVSPTGSDSGSGSLAQPWRRIAFCMSVANAGDTCVVSPGQYQESVRIVRSGELDHPIRLQSGAKTAIILGQLEVSGSHIIVEGFTVQLTSGTIRGVDISGSGVSLLDSHITSDSFALGLNNVGINVSGSGNVVEKNLVDNTCFGIQVQGSNNQILANEITRLSIRGVCGDVDYLRFFGTGHVIQRNRLYGVDMSTMSIDIAHVDCFQTFDVSGLSFRNVLIEGNFCADAHQGVIASGAQLRQSEILIVRNNIFTRVTAFCGVSSDIKTTLYYNNLCDTRQAYHGLWCRGDTGRGSCEFKNNIVFGSGTLYGVMEAAVLINGTATAPGSNNLLYKTSGSIEGFSGDVINRNPLFVDLAADNFQLMPTSPAVGAGVAISGWHNALDIAGTSRPASGGWDIGPYQRNEPPRSPDNLRVVPPL